MPEIVPLQVQVIAFTKFEPPADVPWETDVDGGQALAEFVARTLGRPLSDLQVAVLSDAISSANFSALLWWATNRDDGDPASVVVEALDVVLAGPITRLQ